MDAGTYSIQPFALSDEELTKVAALLHLVFPKAGFTFEFLHWQYVLNPDGRALGYNAWLEDGTLVGHYAAMPLVANLFGVSETGLLSINTVTHPQHAGKGLFTALARKTYEAARSTGHGYVVGVANAASTSGFTNKLGFQLVGPLRAMLGVGKVARNTANDTAFERIWSVDTLQWRLAHPFHQYSKVCEGDGVTLCSATEVPVITAVMGHFSGMDKHFHLQEKRWKGVQLHLGLDPSADWDRSAYINIPQRFRPSPLNLIFLNLKPNGRRLNSDQVLFRALDFDAY